MSDYPFKLCKRCYMEVIDLDSHMEVCLREVKNEKW